MNVNRRQALIGMLVLAGWLAYGDGTAEAQRLVRVAGTVQWVAGSRMQVMTDGGSVSVDLRDADQGSYQGLRSGDQVVVDGVVSGDRTRLLAREIWRMPDNVPGEAP